MQRILLSGVQCIVLLYRQETMANDWIHCNACYRQPSQGIVFLFSSCGHIICQKCATTADKTKLECSCPVCQRKCTFVEINRSLRPELQIYFRNPKDLATQYMKTLAQVLEFQASNRSRFTKHIAEKEKKATKFAHLARDEIKRRIELESNAVEENTRLKCELNMERMRCRDLEAKLSENEKKIEELRKGICTMQSQVPRSDSGIDAEMESESGLSFLNVATSTPIHSCSPKNRFTSTGHRNRNHISEMFLASSDEIPSPITFPSDQPLTTPAMLGIKHSRRSSSAGRQSHETSKKYDFLTAAT
ncbi:hypothetical protein KIN20_032035 [Parelaphostrongylus tenuis]|uniref:RING-type domain-containing protein n=1 Tax=Parelaphostrongylus tenuis TaxID=148309 RepID=A0AAD5R605_PARTN|nr:hypothetical protein KIN20_032035 [Parelaphostrongylus tenuis]